MCSFITGVRFRSKSYKFEEFLANWYEKLQGTGEGKRKATTVTVRLLQEIERYKVNCENLHCFLEHNS